jgi:hypothetical protein
MTVETGQVKAVMNRYEKGEMLWLTSKSAAFSQTLGTRTFIVVKHGTEQSPWQVLVRLVGGPLNGTEKVIHDSLVTPYSPNEQG